MGVIRVFGKLREKDHRFEANLDHPARICL